MRVGEARETAEADERLLLRTPQAAAFLAPVPTAPNALAHRPVEAPAHEAARRLRAIRPALVAAFPRPRIETFRSMLREEADRGAAFLWLPVVMGTGAVIYFALPSEPSLSSILLASVLLAGLAWLARGRQALKLSISALFLIVAGMLAGKVETIGAGTRMLGSEVTTHLTGRVMGIEQDDKGRYRLVVDVVSTARPQLRYGTDRIRALAVRIPAGLEIGDGISGVIHLRPQSGPLRPHGYDFGFQGYFRGLGANGFFFGTPTRVALGPPGFATRVVIVAARLRRALTDRIVERVGGEEGPIAAALITGVTTGISDGVNDAFRTSGLSHLLAISGMNLALVGVAVIYALRALFALFPDYSARRPVKKHAVAAGAAVIAAYFLISGAGIATQRSLVMLAVMFLAVLLDRAAITMRNLALATLVVVLLEPHEIMGPSFQMSFAATAALIGAYGWWSKRSVNGSPAVKARRPFAFILGAGRFLFGVATTSLIAGAATGIFAAFHFSRIAPLGIVANVLAVPLFSFLIMPLALVAVLAIPFGLDGMAFRLLGHSISLVVRIAEGVAAWTSQAGTGPMPISAFLLLSLALLIATLAFTRLRYAAIPVGALGLLLFQQARPPDVIISENAKLVGLRVGGDVIALNTARPDAFTLDDWRRAYRVSYVAGPDKTSVPESITGTFSCTGDLCLAKEDGGVDLAYAGSQTSAQDACRLGRIVVLAYPARHAGCSEPGRIVVTARELALKGALEIRLPPASGAPPVAGAPPDSPQMQSSSDQRIASAELAFAAPALERPWHAQRAYSMAARGIDPAWRKRIDRRVPPQAAGGPVHSGDRHQTLSGDRAPSQRCAPSGGTCLRHELNTDG